MGARQDFGAVQAPEARNRVPQNAALLLLVLERTG